MTAARLIAELARLIADGELDPHAVINARVNGTALPLTGEIITYAPGVAGVILATD